MKIKRKLIRIDEVKCTGCGLCVPSCAEGAIQIVDGKARLVAEKYCDGLGACLGECPEGALSIREEEADEFDPEAVDERCQQANLPAVQSPSSSALSHWPVQIRLVPPTAPFLRGADLLVVADCTPVAYPRFHEDFLFGKVVLVGCPKFDDTQAYVERFTRIFQENDIKSVTVLVMDVPCCQGLPVIVQKGLELSGKNVPLKKVTISRQGIIL
ncbi:MAG: 4Fe-4S binding protein [Syntrophales bacterium]|jgi:Pyruvate/2-oxoacid:ferredoxin oxidoreductase delta subunit